ncbi:MAG: hypothetical protein KC656_21600, partial [Myxococcales bacterium]|nr:hypothetical protein [Myxococcales bacterium]
ASRRYSLAERGVLPLLIPLDELAVESPYQDAIHLEWRLHPDDPHIAVRRPLALHDVAASALEDALVRAVSDPWITRALGFILGGAESHWTAEDLHDPRPG